MSLRACNVEINETVLFSTTSQGLNPSNPLATCMFLSSNVTITGDVTFANNVRRAISAYSSTITLSSGNILFVNNSGVSGGAMALYSSNLNIQVCTFTTTQPHRQEELFMLAMNAILTYYYQSYLASTNYWTMMSMAQNKLLQQFSHGGGRSHL